MKWRGRERSSNIEDRRGAPRSTGGSRPGYSPLGGMRFPTGRTTGGIGTIIAIVVVLGIIWFATGQNPLESITGTPQTPSASSTTALPTNAGEDELAQFVGVVVKETENLWHEVFRQNNL